MMTSRHCRLAQRLIAKSAQYAPAEYGQQGQTNSQNQSNPQDQQSTLNFQQFSQSLQQEASTWEQYGMKQILQAIGTHAQAAGFPPQATQKMQRNFQLIAAKENLQTALYMALNTPDLVHTGYQASESGRTFQSARSWF